MYTYTLHDWFVQLIGQHYVLIIQAIGTYSSVMILSYIHLNSTAASILLVTLLPLATVPIIIRSSLSVKLSDEADISNEQSNHVRMYVYSCICEFK